VAQMALADALLRDFLASALIPYEQDEVTQLILDSHDARAFEPVGHLTVGGFRDWCWRTRRRRKSLSRSRQGSPPRWSPRCRR
jgi:ethanolamine ammonia-lyase large subunit